MNTNTGWEPRFQGRGGCVAGFSVPAACAMNSKKLFEGGRRLYFFGS